jgi:8-oxo-dGTP pyrophosphatase MutT (NUDIX family)
MSPAARQPELIVGALLLNSRGQVFVARFSKIAGHYAIPGGHVEYGETVGEALVRELHEETNLVATRYRLFRVSERIRPPLYKDGNHHLVYLDFLIDTWHGDLQLDGEELNDGRWLLPEEALALTLTITTRQAIEHFVAHGPPGRDPYQPGLKD